MPSLLVSGSQDAAAELNPFFVGDAAPVGLSCGWSGGAIARPDVLPSRSAHDVSNEVPASVAACEPALLQAYSTEERCSRLPGAQAARLAGFAQVFRFLSVVDAAQLIRASPALRAATQGYPWDDAQTQVPAQSLHLWRASFPNAQGLTLAPRSVIPLCDADFRWFRGLRRLVVDDCKCNITEEAFLQLQGIKQLSMRNSNANSSLTDFSLQCLCGIRSLSVTGDGSFPFSRDGFSYLSGIEELCIAGGGSNPGVFGDAVLAQLKGIRRLQLILGQSGMHTQSELLPLEEMTGPDTAVQQAAYTDAGLAHLTGILELDLSNSSLSVTSPETRLRSLVQLRVLRLEGCTLDGSIDALFAPLVALEELLCSRCTGFVAAAVAPLLALRKLDVSHCTNITDADCAHFQHVPELKLSGCQQLTDAAFVHLSHVTSLDISHCSQEAVSDLGVAQLTAIRTLAMRGCEQRALTHAVLATLSHLRHLEVSHCPNRVIPASAFSELGSLHTIQLQRTKIATKMAALRAFQGNDSLALQVLASLSGRDEEELTPEQVEEVIECIGVDRMVHLMQQCTAGISTVAVTTIVSPRSANASNCDRTALKSPATFLSQDVLCVDAASICRIVAIVARDPRHRQQLVKCDALPVLCTVYGNWKQRGELVHSVCCAMTALCHSPEAQEQAIELGVVTLIADAMRVLQGGEWSATPALQAMLSLMQGRKAVQMELVKNGVLSKLVHATASGVIGIVAHDPHKAGKAAIEVLRILLDCNKDTKLLMHAAGWIPEVVEALHSPHQAPRLMAKLMKDRENRELVKVASEGARVAVDAVPRAVSAAIDIMKRKVVSSASTLLSPTASSAATAAATGRATSSTAPVAAPVAAGSGSGPCLGSAYEAIGESTSTATATARLDTIETLSAHTAAVHEGANTSGAMCDKENPFALQTVDVLRSTVQIDVAQGMTSTLFDESSSCQCVPAGASGSRIISAGSVAVGVDARSASISPAISLTKSTSSSVFDSVVSGDAGAVSRTLQLASESGTTALGETMSLMSQYIPASWMWQSKRK